MSSLSERLLIGKIIFGEHVGVVRCVLPTTETELYLTRDSALSRKHHFEQREAALVAFAGLL